MSHPNRLRVALLGQAFMGRAHSNAWSQVGKFFDLPAVPVLHTICGRDAAKLRAFAARWGWRYFSTDWRAVVACDDIDLVDIGTPNHLHLPMAKAALAAGKHVACEKPLAGTLADAREMAHLAAEAKGGTGAGQKTFVWYNYRRCPAVALAYSLVRTGKIGPIRHVRAFYLQDWAGPDVPLAWRFDRRQAGSGALGDLAAHIVDMTRFVTGQEITAVCGAMAETFIKRRRVMSGSAAGGIAAGLKRSAKTGKVTVDDAVAFLARFSGGAMATFEAARQATGNQNRNGFEINGVKGALRFNF
jgi:predicted dehydrogenase